MEVEHLNEDDLLFLKNIPREELDTVMGDLTSLSVVPPYDLASEQNTAVMASSIKKWYPSRVVGIVMPMVMPSRICQLVRTFNIAGFSPIIFTKQHNIRNLLPRLKNHLAETQWYHVCDPKFNIPHEGVSGKWTKGECL